jgi:hypothetical protein
MVIWLGIVAITLLLAAPVNADAPQFTVEAANWAFNAHTSNWICDPQSDLDPNGNPPQNCYGMYPPASYMFMHHVYYTEKQFSGQYVGLVDGGARDGGFEDRWGDTSSTFLMQGPQGGTHTLREVEVQYAPLKDLHWEPDSTLWDTDQNALEVFETVFTTGVISTSSRQLPVRGEELRRRQ